MQYLWLLLLALVNLGYQQSTALATLPGYRRIKEDSKDLIQFLPMRISYSPRETGRGKFGTLRSVTFSSQGIRYLANTTLSKFVKKRRESKRPKNFNCMNNIWILFFTVYITYLIHVLL